MRLDLEKVQPPVRWIFHVMDDTYFPTTLEVDVFADLLAAVTDRDQKQEPKEMHKPLLH